MADPTKAIEKQIAEIEKQLKKAKSDQGQGKKRLSEWEKLGKDLSKFESEIKDVTAIE
ncbi:MAG: hypothetical protein AB8B51_08715 [Sedimentitalea sp.]